MRMRTRTKRRRRRKGGERVDWRFSPASVDRAMGGEGHKIHSQAAPLVRPVDAGQHFNLIRGHPPHERSTTKIQ